MRFILACDVGNTSVNTGFFDGSGLLLSFRVPTCSVKKHYERLLREHISVFLTAGYRIDAIIASVVPDLDRLIKALLFSSFGIRARFLTYRTGLDIILDYDDPSQIGADRIANAAAVYGLFREDSIVVDFGTATTFDIITGSGVYKGGIILPGVDMSARSLYEKTARLPFVEVSSPDTLIARNTEEAIKSGIFYGTVFQVKSLLGRVKEAMGWKRANIVLTGGYARLFIGHIGKGAKFIPELTLYGLAHIAGRTRSSSEKNPHFLPHKKNKKKS